MKKRPRVLLIGAGGYGQVYLREMLEKDTGADLVGICDIKPESARSALAGREVALYSTLEEFYAQNTADLAIIVSPVHYHLSMALTCFANGSHVLCEKPLCLTLEEAHAMEAAAQKAGRFLSLGYQRNYQRDVLALKEDILAGKFGKPRRLSIYHGFRRGARYYARNNWAGHIRAEGREVLDSPFANASAHFFQLATFLLGKDLRSACDLASVEGELYHGNPAVENYDIAALRFRTPEGVPLLYYTAHTIRSEEMGPHGIFEFEKGTVTFSNEGNSYQAAFADGTAKDYREIGPTGDMQKLYDAIACAREGGAPICGVEADLAHIRAVRMAQELPIRQVRQELRHTMDVEGDTVLYIEGLEDIFADSARQWALPAEAGYILS